MGFDFKALLSNPAALAIGLSGAGGFLGNRKETTTQTTGTNLTPEQAALLKSIQDQYANLNKDPNLSGYEAGQVSDINHLAALHLQNVQENAAQRGITGDALGNAENAVDSQRFSDIVKLHQQIPLLQNQIQSQNINTGLGVFGATPKNTISTNTTPNNSAAGGLSNAAATLAYFLGQGAFKKPQAGVSASQPIKTPTFNPGPFFTPSYGSVNRTPNYNPGY